MKKINFLLLLIFVFGMAGCGSGTKCSDWSADTTGASWGNCSDKSQRAIECKTSDPGKYACDCRKNDTVERHFERTDIIAGDKAATAKIANDACGWDIVP